MGKNPGFRLGGHERGRQNWAFYGPVIFNDWAESYNTVAQYQTCNVFRFFFFIQKFRFYFCVFHHIVVFFFFLVKILVLCFIKMQSLV